METIYDFEADDIDGGRVAFDAFRGRVLLIVNTASRCGFTPQFDGLEALHRAHAGQGLVVLGFPSNQFGAQDPGSDAEIGAFCRTHHGVSFRMMRKIDVNGDKALPLFDHLKKEKPGVLGLTAIKWNFTKFLVDRAGKVVARYGSTTTPASLTRDIEKFL